MGRRKNRGGQIEPAVWKKIQTSDMSLCWGNPETLGVQVGFTDLTPLHGEWIRQMVIGNGDYTLQAHRGAYKSSCLALAIALIMVIYPRRNIIFIPDRTFDRSSTNLTYTLLAASITEQ